MHRSDHRSDTNNTTNLSQFGTILCELGLCEHGALARNSLLAVLVAAWVPESHRKGAKDAKGNSQGRKWRLVIDTMYTESSFLPYRLYHPPRTVGSVLGQSDHLLQRPVPNRPTHCVRDQSRSVRMPAWGNHDLAHLGPGDAHPHPYPRHRLGRWDPVLQTQTHATPKKAIHRATYHWAIHRGTRYQAGIGDGQCANSLDPDPRRSRGV